jgi:hypothetical protein
VLAWRQGLLGLAERLERPEPVNPCGVARALLLLTDGIGPLYDSGAARSIADAVWWIANGLQPSRPVFTTSVCRDAVSEWSLDFTEAKICPWTS